MTRFASLLRRTAFQIDRSQGLSFHRSSINGRLWLAAAAVASCGAAFAPLASSAEERGDGPIAAPSPQEDSLLAKLAHLTSFFHSGRSPPSPPPSPSPSSASLPTDKLRCHRQPGRFDPGSYRPVVLVSCGSFNPPTLLHLRMMELAREGLTQAGFDVLGGYLSPVNDAYWKQGLARGVHRVRMCQLATADSDTIMVDPWEAEQQQYTRTLHVLQHVQRELAAAFDQGEEEVAVGSCPTSPHPRAMLVCGADVVLSMADPKAWRQDLLEDLLSRHGVVCISREGSDVEGVLQRPGTLLHRYRSNVVVVREPVTNDVSSSKVRHQLQQGRSVKYLVPDSVIQYIQDHGLYREPPAPCTPSQA